jgi:16S rRNA processing protein RimM
LPDRLIQLGVIGRAHGVRGHVRVTSYTEEPADLTRYGELSDASGRRFMLRWVGEDVAEVAEIVGGKRVKVTDRAQAEKLTNRKLFIEREKLPAPEADEYYLADLIGLTAVDEEGVRLGLVSTLHDYGGGASLEIQREDGTALIVPFTAACVPEVDLAAGRLVIIRPAELEVPSPPPEGAERPGEVGVNPTETTAARPRTGNSRGNHGRDTRTSPGLSAPQGGGEGKCAA